jgi:undecaprenyl-diphosphatase
METVSQIDTEIFLWINDWVGTSLIFDRVIQWIVSDYLIPIIFSVVLLGLWFGWADQAMRERHQRGVMLGGASVGMANIMVKISNVFYFRHRPFDSIDVNLLFYPPTDSSFPANPIAITVAMATGVWMANRRIGTLMYIGSFVYGFSRVYSGVFYPLDVVGGALIGISAVCLLYIVFKRIEPVPTLCLRLVRFLCFA